jgi:hypothetical protein
MKQHGILFILSKTFLFCLASQHVAGDEGEGEHEADDEGD